MKIWFEITPIDTLFFRGSEPMEAGQLPSAPLFPPPVSVIQGSLRTALLMGKGMSFSDYKKGTVPDEVCALIGKCGDSSPFSVTAIVMKKGGIVYAPAPASWFIDAPEKPPTGSAFTGQSVKVATSTADDAKSFGIVSSSGVIPLVVAKEEAIPLSGCWVNPALFSKKEIVFSENDILTDAELFATENRVGIAIDSRRKVEEGKLYSANHIRLPDGVTILVAVDREMGLAGAGLFQLGGEQRRSRFERLGEFPSIPEVLTPKGYVALAPVEATSISLPKVVAAYKPVMTAGWDLSRGFHKPSTTWFPAGSVFSEQITNACIPIAL